MFRNYIKVALRNLWRHRVFSFINILGLTVGLTAFYLIFLYVRFELSYDSFHSKAARTYRIVCDIKTPTETIPASGPSWAVSPHLKGEFPEIESTLRTDLGSFLVRKGEVKFQEDKTMFVDTPFFHVFDFPLVKGNPATALKEPFSIIMSETTAKKYFGTSDPMGQTVILTSDNFPAKITGVMKDFPENSIMQADMLISMSTITQKFNPGLDDQWGNYSDRTYVLLKPGTDPKALEAKFPSFLVKKNGDEMKKLQMFPTLTMERLRDVYLRSTRDGSTTGNISTVIIFSIIGIFILLIACFNFINLTTARSAERAREVGIRKVVGALKSQLARQFTGESVIIALISFVLSVVLSLLLLPLFNRLSGKTIAHGIFEHLQYLLVLLITSLGVGVLAGIYPALVLSSFQPVSVLKGRFSTGAKGSLLRKGLVIAQFTVSIALIIATLIVYNQMVFMRSQDLGFEKDRKMVIDTHGDNAKEAFRQAVASLPNVVSTSLAGSVPGGDNPGAYSQIQNKKGEMQIANLDLYFVDFDYIPQYKMKMLAGRPFSRDFGSDTTQAMILNEAALKMFGYRDPQEAIGRKFDQWGRSGTIIGVVKDFHFRSLQEVIKPLSIRIEPNGCSLVTVELGHDIPGTIQAIENKWKALIPNRPFSYYFLDEYFDRQYRSEIRFGRLFLNFSILAIFISCLGLLGLASYSTMQRTKEIGIRKVMGATVMNIVQLLSVEFLRLVSIAFIIAVPIAWYFMHKWLHGFAYRVDLGWFVFGAAGITAFMVALLTVSFQAFRAAVASPANTLRTE